jgi:diguanylate cyclase (GGDEF)-like protein
MQHDETNQLSGDVALSSETGSLISSSIVARILILGDALPVSDGIPRAQVLRADQVPTQTPTAPKNSLKLVPEDTASFEPNYRNGTTHNGTEATGAERALGESSTHDAFTGIYTGLYVGLNDNQGGDVALPAPESLVTIQPSAPSSDFGALRATLEAAGHIVSFATEDAPLKMNEDLSPEILLLEFSTDPDVTSERCRTLKERTKNYVVSVVVALPTDLHLYKSSNEIVTQLLESGADDFLEVGAPDYQNLTRIRSQIKWVRTRRELEATREYLRLQLQTDDLTNLLNRRFFFQAAHREYDRARRYGHALSCLMIDIDHFRRFSESCGYECGEAVLRHVADVLRASTRDVDIAARFGEEKFVVLLPETDLTAAAVIGENIQKMIAESSFMWRGQPLPLSISVGEAVRNNETRKEAPATTRAGEESLSHREEVAEFLEEADAALFVAKRGVKSATLLETPLAPPRFPVPEASPDLPRHLNG